MDLFCHGSLLQMLHNLYAVTHVIHTITTESYMGHLIFSISFSGRL